MLAFLQIRDFAIIDALDLEVCEGFTCITGETGAGKSILVDALGMLSGNRADSTTVRSGAARAELCAGFELAPDSAAVRWLRACELDDGTACLLRRVINDSGRSRAWINGRAVTLQQLAELGELLIEIHGQNEHIRLVRSTEQFRLLDAAGDHDAELRILQQAYEAWHVLDGEKRTLLEEEPLDAGETDLLRYQLTELDDHLLPAESFLELEAEHRALARGGEVLEALETTARALDSDSDGAARTLHRAANRLEPHATLGKDIGEAARMLREAAINCDEAVASIESARGRLDLSPARLAEVERLLGRQHDLARKHRVEPDQLEQVRDRLSERLERAATLGRRLEEIDREIQRALETYCTAATRLHQCRSARARQLEAAVTATMQELGMAGGCFEFEVRLDEESPPSARGSDRLELRVSANPGSPPGPLRKIASGGELSRISLAIKVASQAAGGAVTQIFDEVDAGIGGATAHAVGKLLRSLASGRQALCVTHLAQVAVFADQQVRVVKTSDDETTRVETSVLSEPERVDEIARMLGGRLSKQSRAHAAELLAAAS